MKRHLLFLFIIMSASALAQSVFQRTYGGVSNDMAYSLQQTFEGGFIIAGVTASFGAGNVDVYVVKTNSMGDTLWTKTLGTDSADYAYAIQQTTDSGYIIAGYTFAYTTFYPDAYFIKTDANGDTLWTKIIIGSLWDGVVSVEQTSDGGYIAAGYTTSVTTLPAIYVIKLDAGGNLDWTKTYDGGGGLGETGYDVKQTSDGGYIIAARQGGYDAVRIIRTDASGDTLFSKKFANNSCVLSTDLEITSDGGFIICSWNSADAELTKTDSAGNPQWRKNYGGAFTDMARSVKQTSDGGYVIGGSTYDGVYNHFYIIKTDQLGDTLWTKAFGGATGQSEGYSIIQTSDGGYALAGLTNSFGAGGYDFYLIKTNSAGYSCNEIAAAETVTAQFFTSNDNPVQISSSGTITNGITEIGYGGMVNIACSPVEVSSIAAQEEFEVSVFPNPSDGKFDLRFTIYDLRFEKAEMEIYNVIGESVGNWQLVVGDTHIDLTKLPKGIYFLRVQASTAFSTKKIIIQ